MNKRGLLFNFLFLVLITLVFFYKTVFFGHIPFPGDLLIAEYKPWSTYSYLGYNSGSYPNKAQYFDVLRQLYPWKIFAMEQLKHGIIPIWNPYNFSGSPLFANFQSAVLYPLNIFYFLFSFKTAWTLLVILQPFLALVFTYGYARKIRISKTASLFAAASFAFSSFMTVWLEYNTIGHVIVWISLALLSVEQLLEEKKLKWIIAFIFSLTASLFAGHIQIFAYEYIFVLVYVLYKTWNSRHSKGLKQIREFLFWPVLFIFPLLLGAVQILPGLELIKESARSVHSYDLMIHKILIQPWQLIMFFVPDFFGNPATRNYWQSDTYVGKVTSIGMVAVPFVLLSFRKWNDANTRFFLLSALVILLFTTLNPFTVILYKFSIPFISSSAPTLSIFLFCFCVSILSGFGIDLWRKNENGFKKSMSALFFIYTFFWVVSLTFPQLIHPELVNHVSVAMRNLFYTTVVTGFVLLLLLVAKRKKNLQFFVIVLLFIVQTGDLWRSFHKFNPFVPASLVYPDTAVFKYLQRVSGINRFWGYGNAAVEANISTAYQLSSSDGYDPLYPKRYGSFIESSKNGKLLTAFTTQNRSDGKIAPGFGKVDLSSNQYRLRALDVLGIKYILDRIENGSTAETFPPDRFSLVYEKDGWRIFENLKAAPRAFLVSDYRIFKTNQEFERIFFDKNFNQLKTVLLEESIPLSLNVLKHLNKAYIVDYAPDKILIHAETDENQLLFLSDVFYPGWKAWIDDKETKIYRANYAFRAVMVPKGNHTIIFSYEPKSFKIGLIISLSSLEILVFWMIFLSKQKYNKNIKVKDKI